MDDSPLDEHFYGDSENPFADLANPPNDSVGLDENMEDSHSMFNEYGDMDKPDETLQNIPFASPHRDDNEFNLKTEYDGSTQNYKAMDTKFDPDVDDWFQKSETVQTTQQLGEKFVNNDYDGSMDMGEQQMRDNVNNYEMVERNQPHNYFVEQDPLLMDPYNNGNMFEFHKQENNYMEEYIPHDSPHFNDNQFNPNAQYGNSTMDYQNNSYLDLDQQNNVYIQQPETHQIMEESRQVLDTNYEGEYIIVEEVGEDEILTMDQDELLGYFFKQDTSLDETPKNDNVFDSYEQVDNLMEERNQRGSAPHGNIVFKQNNRFSDDGELDKIFEGGREHGLFDLERNPHDTLYEADSYETESYETESDKESSTDVEDDFPNVGLVSTCKTATSAKRIYVTEKQLKVLRANYKKSQKWDEYDLFRISKRTGLCFGRITSWLSYRRKMDKKKKNEIKRNQWAIDIAAEIDTEKITDLPEPGAISEEEWLDGLYQQVVTEDGPNMNDGLDNAIMPPRRKPKIEYRANPEQLEILMEYYKENNYVQVGDKPKLAAELGWTEEQVKEWFKSRRSRERVQAKKLEKLKAIREGRIVADFPIPNNAPANGARDLTPLPDSSPTMEEMGVTSFPTPPHENVPIVEEISATSEAASSCESEHVGQKISVASFPTPPHDIRSMVEETASTYPASPCKIDPQEQEAPAPSCPTPHSEYELIQPESPSQSVGMPDCDNVPTVEKTPTSSYPDSNCEIVPNKQETLSPPQPTPSCDMVPTEQEIPSKPISAYSATYSSRYLYSAEAEAILEEIWEKRQILEKDESWELAAKTGLSEKEVKLWFHRRRGAKQIQMKRKAQREAREAKKAKKQEKENEIKQEENKVEIEKENKVETKKKGRKGAGKKKLCEMEMEDKENQQDHSIGK